MKIMHVNVVYQYGSTGKIVESIHKYLLNENYKSLVCYGRGNTINEHNVHKIGPEIVMKFQSLYSKVTGYAYGGAFFSTTKLIKIIEKEKPDIVHLHCINGYMVNIYKILDYLKKSKLKVVLTLHAEFMYTAGCGNSLNCEKWKEHCCNCPQRSLSRPASRFFDRSAEEWEMMKSAFDGFENIIIVAVSQWLADRARNSPFLKDKDIRVINNGIDTKNIFKITDYSEIKKEISINNEKIILHVTPDFLNPLKGGDVVLELAKRFRSNDNVKFLIVGYNGKPSLPSNVIAISHTKNQKELAGYYSMANLTLLTSKNETFSMVCAESLSCGTPVVGFKAGAPETISIKEYSEFVEADNLDLLEIAVRKWIDFKSNSNNSKKMEILAREKYANAEMCKKYLNIYKDF